MLVSTLTRYFARLFTVTTITIFVSICLLILLIDYIELMRRTAAIESASAMTVARTSLYRVPQIAERLMASCIQIGTMVSYLTLSRRLELVVARASGISAWQFLFPAAAASMILGVAATMLFNPMSASLQEQAKRAEAAFFGDLPQGFHEATGFWVNQVTSEGKAILNAAGSLDQGQRLTGITVFRFDANDRFIERIEAREATLEDGHWHLKGARSYAMNDPIRSENIRLLKTNLTRSQVLESFATPETVSFWQLPDYIATSEKSGLAAAGYRLQYHRLISRPFLFAATVLLAGAMSLRTFRFGGVHKMILGGVAAGFLLYVLAKVTEDLGTAELMHPVVAAWLPIVVGGMVGIMGLLYQEDG
jgi:lipopolysaccharide export system permease protein